jgi:inorganic pyrophosphatase
VSGPHTRIALLLARELPVTLQIMAAFIVLFGVLVFVLVGSSDICGGLINNADGAFPAFVKGSCWVPAAFTTLSFVLGGVTSIVAGYIGMKIAVFSNARTAIQCSGGLAANLVDPKYRTEEQKWKEGFNCAFRAGSVMGFSLTGVGVLVLYLSTLVYKIYSEFQVGGLCKGVADGDKCNANSVYGHSQALFECVAGFGLGGSSIALFGRVGGGIYTKAADVGADLVGKVEKDLPEDDIRNSACIADNVGDNVGDVAGMGADLFGSFAESSSAALVIAAASFDLSQNWASLMFPIMVSAVGIFACLVTHFAIYIPGLAVTKESKVEQMLQLQLYVSTILATPIIFVLAYVSLPTVGFCTNYAASAADPTALTCVIGGFTSNGFDGVSWWGCAISVCLGLWGGLAIGVYTDFMTSLRHQPTQEVADSCKTGAATNIIYGLALGYKSCVIPVFVLVIAIYGSWRLADMYGISLAALGMLSTLATGLTIDAYGPVCDNAGGFAEMADMHESVRVKTDALDAAGNTTAAVGKGFAIGSAALVSLALFGAFTVRTLFGQRKMIFYLPLHFTRIVLTI